MKNLDQVLKALPDKRRAGIERRAQATIRKIALSELRKLAGVSQAKVAKRMGVRQPTVSQIESQSDMKISTLASWVASLGGTMKIVVQTPQGEFIIAQP